MNKQVCTRIAVQVLQQINVPSNFTTSVQRCNSRIRQFFTSVSLTQNTCLYRSCGRRQVVYFHIESVLHNKTQCSMERSALLIFTGTVAVVITIIVTTVIITFQSCQSN